MSSSETSLFDPQELRRLATLYDAERYLFDIVSPRFAQTGTLPPYDFFAIVIWKSPIGPRRRSPAALPA